MTAIRTTLASPASPNLVIAPYLHDREIGGVLDALDAGDLLAVVRNDTGGIGAGEIVALAAPDLAKEIASRDDEEIKELRRDLSYAQRELKSLREIVGEVFAEDDPLDYTHRIYDAIDDVKREVDSAAAIVEEMK